jgi:hypothetical protein
LRMNDKGLYGVATLERYSADPSIKEVTRRSRVDGNAIATNARRHLLNVLQFRYHIPE